MNLRRTFLLLLLLLLMAVSRPDSTETPSASTTYVNSTLSQPTMVSSSTSSSVTLPSPNSTSSPSSNSSLSTSPAMQSSNTSTSSQATSTTSNITASLPTSSPSNSSTLSTNSALSISETMQPSNTSTSSQATSITSNITASLPTSSLPNSSTFSTNSALSISQTMQPSNTSTSTSTQATLTTSNITASLPTSSPSNSSTVSTNLALSISQTMQPSNTSASTQDTVTSNITASLPTSSPSNSSTFSTNPTLSISQTMQPSNTSTSTQVTLTTSNITASLPTSSPSNSSTVSTNSTLLVSQTMQPFNTSTSTQATATTSNITASLPTSSPSNSSTVSTNSTLLVSQTMQPSNTSTSSQATATTSSITASLPTSSPSNSSTVSTNSTSSISQTMQPSNTSTSTQATLTTSNITASLPISSPSNSSTVPTNSTSSISQTMQPSNTSTSTQATLTTSNITASLPISSPSNSSTVPTNSTSSISQTMQPSNTSTSTQATLTTSNITASLPTSSPSNSSTVSTNSTLLVSQTMQPFNTSTSTQATATTSNITASLPTSSPSNSSTVSTNSTLLVSQTMQPFNTSTSTQATATTSNITASLPTSSSSNSSTLPITILTSNTTNLSVATLLSTTSSPSQSSQTTTTISTVDLRLKFKIRNKNFTDNLKNTSSSDFISLKANVEKEMTIVYKAKFRNFKKVTVTGFMEGSVIVESILEFDNSTTPAPDNIVRALVSSIQSNGSVGDLEILSESIIANGVNVTNLAPLNISISFLIKRPYNRSEEGMLTTQANTWINHTLSLLPNTTAAGNSTIVFGVVSGWTNASAFFPINSIRLLDVNTTLSNLISFRQLAGFTIVPDTLIVEGQSLNFNIIRPPLRILNIPQSANFTVKSSLDFQHYSKAIEDSFKDIFRTQLVEPVVTNFIYDPFTVMASVDLYFQNDTINKPDVITQIKNNEGTFRKNNLILDLLLLDPKVGVQVTATLIRDYTPSLSNASSSDAIELQNTILNLLTPELRKFYSNSLQDSPTVVFNKNADGLAAMIVQYKLNYTMNVDSSLVLASLLNNDGLTNITHIASWSVNNIQQSFDVFTLKPRFINHFYAESLKERNSTMFMDLESNITRGLRSILKTLSLKQIVVLSLQSGSVIGVVETTFAPAATSYLEVTKKIVDNKNALAELNLDLDPQSLYANPPAPTISPPESSVPGYGVAIIVMCILLILAVPIVIFLAFKTDLCQKLSNACSLKTPYKRYDGVNFGSPMTGYRTHSYDVTN